MREPAVRERIDIMSRRCWIVCANGLRRKFLLHSLEGITTIEVMDRLLRTSLALLLLAGTLLPACAARSRLEVYRDQNFDFNSVRIVAVVPFENLTKETQASNRVRDVFMNMLLSTGAVYVLPAGEV